uniref:Uncharacterized protein n=1 Tax=Anopheles atroparvus TaxID=41427 RepID=A0A182J8T5_ANOAO
MMMPRSPAGSGSNRDGESVGQDSATGNRENAPSLNAPKRQIAGYDHEGGGRRARQPPGKEKGALCHRIGSLECPPDRTPAYAQLYYYVAQEEQQGAFDVRVNIRTNLFSQVELDSGIVAKIARILAEHHPLATSFQYAYERLHDPAYPRSTNVATIGQPQMKWRASLSFHQESQQRTSGSDGVGMVHLVQAFEQNQMSDGVQCPLLHPTVLPSGVVGPTSGQTRRCIFPSAPKTALKVSEVPYNESDSSQTRLAANIFTTKSLNVLHARRRELLVPLATNQPGTIQIFKRQITENLI